MPYRPPAWGILRRVSPFRHSQWVGGQDLLAPRRAL